MRAFPISKCRICACTALREVYRLGELASCGVFPLSSEQDPPVAPLTLVQCHDCSLVQLAHDFLGDDLFRHTYGYRSGINESMVSHLKGIVQSLTARVSLSRGDIVLDIGSNDGTLLSFYSAPGITRLGIDPTSDRFKDYYPPGVVNLADFFTHANFERLAPGQRAKIITSISMFYDLPDPNSFVADIAATLAPDGIWVFEQSYLPTMIERGSFDTICHEHLEYYAVEPIKRLLETHGLVILDVLLNDVNGGSFQVWAGHVEGPHKPNSAKVQGLLQREKKDGYMGPAPIEGLAARVAKSREQVLAFLNKARAEGKIVHGYGASTKGNTLLQHFGITPDLLPAIADRNQDKFGCRTPGTRIPIISEQASREMKPDYYFVLPWHFRDAFLIRERAFLEGGGAFVFPLPEFEIVRTADGPRHHAKTASEKSVS